MSQHVLQSPLTDVLHGPCAHVPVGRGEHSSVFVCVLHTKQRLLSCLVSTMWCQRITSISASSSSDPCEEDHAMNFCCKPDASIKHLLPVASRWQCHHLHKHVSSGWDSDPCGLWITEWLTTCSISIEIHFSRLHQAKTVGVFFTSTQTNFMFAPTEMR